MGPKWYSLGSYRACKVDKRCILCPTWPNHISKNNRYVHKLYHGSILWSVWILVTCLVHITISDHCIAKSYNIRKTWYHIWLFFLHPYIRFFLFQPWHALATSCHPHRENNAHVLDFLLRKATTQAHCFEWHESKPNWQINNTQTSLERLIVPCMKTKTDMAARCERQLWHRKMLLRSTHPVSPLCTVHTWYTYFIRPN